MLFLFFAFKPTAFEGLAKPVVRVNLIAGLGMMEGRWRPFLA